MTDFDGDFVQLDNGAVVAIENDVPSNNGRLPSRRCLRTADAGELVDRVSGGRTHGRLRPTRRRRSVAGELGADEPGTVKLAGATQAIEGTATGTSRARQVTWHVVSATEVDGVAAAGVLCSRWSTTARATSRSR